MCRPGGYRVFIRRIHQARESYSERAKRNSEGRSAAAVDRRRKRFVKASHTRECRDDLALHWVLNRNIVVQRQPAKDCGHKHACVFARAVVMKLSERLPGNIEFLRGVCAVRSLSPATQRALVEPRPRKHPGYCFGVNRFSLVRRAHDRKLALVDAEMIRRAACDERDRLNRFDSRARRGEEAVVAKMLNDAPVRFGDYYCAAVP